MPHVLWLYAGLDPLRSGELRRLGLPAVALDGEHWACSFSHASAARSHGAVDIAVLPLAAAYALPEVCGGGTRVLIEVDPRTILSCPDAGATLGGLSNRISGVVARDWRAAAWAKRIVHDQVPVWLIADPAARRVELAAARLRFGIPWANRIPEIGHSQGLELWFAEPGDYIEAEEIEQLAQAWSEFDERRLLVAPRLVRAWAAQAHVGARGVEWSPEVLETAFSLAERCVFFGPENYVQARRRVTALRAGAMAAPPVSLATSAFDPIQVSGEWDETLTSVWKGALTAPPRRPTILMLFDLIQDLDLLLPLIDALQTIEPQPHLHLVVSNWLRSRSPRVQAELSRRGLAFEVCERSSLIQGLGPSLQTADAIVAVAESSLPAHEPTRALFARARNARIPTFSLQHGVENVGLHHVTDDDDATITADYLFVWFPPDRTPSSIPAALRPRLIHVGRPPPASTSLADISGVLASFESVVAVFENLHWRRYDQAWRMRFLVDCTELALSDPTRAVILKSHHAGLWTVKNRHLIPQWPPNLIVADPTDPFWEPFTAGSLVGLADVVITTPSTVALDAVQAGKPVAVAAYGLDLPLYAPLPLLHSLEDWNTFIAQAGTIDDARRRASFLTRTAFGDNPSAAAAAFIVEAVSPLQSRQGPEKAAVQ